MDMTKWIADQIAAKKKLALPVLTFPAVQDLGITVNQLIYSADYQEQAMLDIHRRFGKNALLRGISYEDGATARVRNTQVGGHRAGEETVS